MALTQLNFVSNDSAGELLLINTESSRSNRYIGVRSTVDINGVPVPWCTKEKDFSAHHIRIINTRTNRVIWYIWQQNDRDGDFVRISQTGFSMLGPAQKISGSARVGKEYDLWLRYDDVRAEETITKWF